MLILGEGYIGTHLFNFLKVSDISVFSLNRQTLDYHDISKLNKFIVNNDIEYVINCSGFTGKPNVDEAELKKQECWHLNVTSPTKINQLCDKIGVRYIHISSGCIYDGYEKVFNEQDLPNFGVFTNKSSFYSKSKHAFELATAHMNNKIIRIRMPICDDLSNPRNYLKKILEYPKLIDYLNSKTYIPDLCNFILNLLLNSTSWAGQDIYNVVNGDPFCTSRVVNHLNRMCEGNWKVMSPIWVDIEDLDIITSRSNCIIDNTKALSIYKLHSENEILNMVCNYNNGVSAYE